MKKTVKAQITAVSYREATETSVVTVLLDDGVSTWEKQLTYKTTDKIEFARVKNDIKRELRQDLKAETPIVDLTAEIGNIFSFNLN